MRQDDPVPELAPKLGSESGSISARDAEYAEGMGCWPTVESIAYGWIPKLRISRSTN